MTSERIPFMDLSWQWRQIAEGTKEALFRLCENSQYILGPAVEEFEKAFADYLGVEHCVAVNTGTSALHLAMICAGIGPGDKVLLPSHTFVATAWAVVYVGATPVFCDVSPDTGNINVEDAANRMDPSVKCIIPVHLYGQPAPLDAVKQFSDKYGLTIVEDAAQAHGARYNGKPAGTFGVFGCFSFYPGKNLGAGGEGGAVVCHSAEHAKRLRALRNHGQSKRYVHDEIGFNYRMDGIQGLILSRKLEHLERWTSLRKVIAARYLEAFSDLPLELPRVYNSDHVYHLFVIRTPQRDKLAGHLDSRGITTGLHYPVPLHRQPCFAEIVEDMATYPVSDMYAAQCLSLPLYPGMTEEQVEFVVKSVLNFYD